MLDLTISEIFEHSCLYHLKLYFSTTEKQRSIMKCGILSNQEECYQSVRRFVINLASETSGDELMSDIFRKMDEVYEAFKVAIEFGNVYKIFKSIATDAIEMINLGCSIRSLNSWVNFGMFYPDEAVDLRGLLMYYVVKLSSSFGQMWMNRADGFERWDFYDPEHFANGFPGALDTAIESTWKDWINNKGEISKLRRPKYQRPEDIEQDKDFQTYVKRCHGLWNGIVALSNFSDAFLQKGQDGDQSSFSAEQRLVQLSPFDYKESDIDRQFASM